MFRQSLKKKQSLAEHSKKQFYLCKKGKRMDRIIGRDAELAKLARYDQSGKAEFIALYGRRRVGKTSLIRYYFKDKFDFFASGVLEGDKEDQKNAFLSALIKYGYDGPQPKNWNEAFNALGSIIKKCKRKKRCVVFIDEISCFDYEYSNFVKELGIFWNDIAVWYDNIFLVICGSATSWMIRNVIDNRGGLHRRATHEMHLRPFSLYQSEMYFKARHFKWDRMTILQLYAAMGGVPYYFSLLDPTRSAAENIDMLFFSTDAEFKNEFRRLYKSLFRNPEKYMDIIKLLAVSREGMTRKEIASALKMSSGEDLTNMLKDLVYCDLISYNSVCGKKNSGIYRLVDFFTIFYLTFCNTTVTDRAYWRHTLNTPTQNTWYGLAFERICMFHIWEIIQSLRLDTMLTKYYSWRNKPGKPAGQIDMIIERADGITDICEMKYSRYEYTQDAYESKKLERRIQAFQSEYKDHESIRTVLVTTKGLTQGEHSDDFAKVLTLKDLFVENTEEY